MKWVVNKPTRSEIMRAVLSKDTSPELIVRRLLHGAGFRYRLHRKDLPGSPDIVFPSRRKAILIHGCFWHRHDCARGARTPKTNVDYWREKIARNVRRDAASNEALLSKGWQFAIVWECETKRQNWESLTSRLKAFLNG